MVWLRDYSDAGVSRLLKRLGYSWKQALAFVHSPDPEYRRKWHAILDAFLAALMHPDTTVCLFLDEFTYYRQPTLARAYHRRGRSQPRAQQAPRYNTKTRLVAALDGVTGQVLYRQRSKIGTDELIAFAAQIRAAYPDVETIYVVQDNWPVHTLPDVLAALEANRLTPLFLPTYASWLNPIEKLWRWLKQAIIHLHPHAEALDVLRKRVVAFLDQFACGSQALLRYVGLSD